MLLIKILNKSTLTIFFFFIYLHGYSGEIKNLSLHPQEEDERVIITEIQNKMTDWQIIDNLYRDQQITPIMEYGLTPFREKKKFIEKKMLKYLNKKLQNFLKKTQKESKIAYQVYQTQKIFKKKARVQIAPMVKLRIKSNIFQGKLDLILENPYIGWRTNYRIGKHFDIIFSKYFKAINLKTNLKCDLRNKSWETVLQTDFNRHMWAKITSVQNLSEMAFSNASEQKLEFVYKIKDF